ncbi:hypothetical protein MNV49_007358 [Pseudohyphozyma bogoriensis]|nr:hypothetical protein MNV49_007358 [Pseudohyphozyma bogoriensis]
MVTAGSYAFNTAQRAATLEGENLCSVINATENLYEILGVGKKAKSEEIRRGFLSRSRVCHPDKLPHYPQATPAFQRLSYAYETLSKPASRRLYDIGAGGYAPGVPRDSTAMGDETLNGVLRNVFSECVESPWKTDALNEANPGLNFGEEAVENLEGMFRRVHEVVLTGQKYLRVIKFELIRLYEIQHQLRALSYFDIVGRLRLTLALTRVTLEIPMVLDRAMREDPGVPTAGLGAPSVNGNGVNGHDIMSQTSSNNASAKDLNAPVHQEQTATHQAQQRHDPEAKPTTTLVEDVAGAGLEAVFARHGRIDLDPMPSDDPNDPLNWPARRKNILLVLVAFHAFMGTFCAASIISAFGDLAAAFDVSITKASYLVSAFIMFLGASPLVWAPISRRVGRRPVLMFTVLIAACLNFAGAYCKSYGTLMTLRVLQSIFISPPQSIGAEMVSELFFLHEKGQKVGIWALLVTLGPPLGPFVFGFVVMHKSWHWIFYILSMVLLTVEVPSLLGEKYDLNSQQIGLQFIAPLLGGVLGEPIAGWGSDKFVLWRTRQANGEREPEMRLPFALPGSTLAAVGLIIFGVQLNNTAAGHWSVTPSVGSAIALFGLQIVTTVCFAYAIESQAGPDQALVPIFVAFCRQTFAFAAPFYLSDIFTNLGASKAGGLLAAIVGGVGFGLIFVCLVYGKKLRENQIMRVE